MNLAPKTYTDPKRRTENFSNVTFSVVLTNTLLPTVGRDLPPGGTRGFFFTIQPTKEAFDRATIKRWERTPRSSTSYSSTVRSLTFSPMARLRCTRATC
jgi:hypothetical protein